MNAYKEWREGNLTDAEYNSICYQEAVEYAEEMKRLWALDEEGVLEEDEIDEF